MKKKKAEEVYSTEKAWKTTETTNAQADVFRSLADGLRRENLLIKKMLDEKDKKLTEQATDVLDPIKRDATRTAGITAAAGTSLSQSLFSHIFTVRKSFSIRKTLWFALSHFRAL